MSVPSPLEAAGAITSLAVNANGKAMDGTWPVTSLDVWSKAGEHPTARLVLRDGDLPTATFPISDSDALAPGAALEIALGHDGTNRTVFSGTILRHSLAGAGPRTELVIEAVGTSKAADRTTGAMQPCLRVAFGDCVTGFELTAEDGADTRGTVTYPGSALAGVGDMITLAGFGARFSRDVRLTGMHHAMADGSWRTTASFGAPGGT